MNRREIYRIMRIRVADRAPSACGPPLATRILPHEEATDHFGADKVPEATEYGGEGSHGFVIVHAEQIVGVAWYWHGERYRRRNYLNLPSGAAKLVQVVITADKRGRGFGSSLIAESTKMMFTAGFDEIYARIWHSNRASIRAFRKGGWRSLGIALGIPIGRRLLRVFLPPLGGVTFVERSQQQ
jgi:L-amino acid N-acyltransferase YncA